MILAPLDLDRPRHYVGNRRGTPPPPPMPPTPIPRPPGGPHRADNRPSPLPPPKPGEPDWVPPSAPGPRAGDLPAALVALGLVLAIGAGVVLLFAHLGLWIAGVL